MVEDTAFPADDAISYDAPSSPAADSGPRDRHDSLHDRQSSRTSNSSSSSSSSCSSRSSSRESRASLIREPLSRGGRSSGTGDSASHDGRAPQAGGSASHEGHDAPLPQGPAFVGRRAVAARTGHRRARRLSAPQEKAKTLPEMIEEELARLRRQSAEQAQRCEGVERALEAAREDEVREFRALQQRKSELIGRRHELTLRFQTSVRRLLENKQIIGVINREVTEQLGLAAVLPHQLREQLKGLRNTIHDMEYSAEDRVHAATRLQALWRAITARRVFRILRLAGRMRQAHSQMVASAMKIQAWYRAHKTRTRFRVQILMNMGLKCSRQMEDLERFLKVVVLLQRSVRARLARKRVQEARSALNGTPNSLWNEDTLSKQLETREANPKRNVVMLDSWKPGGVAAGLAAVQSASNTAFVGDKMPKRDRELEKIQQAGLIPFYGSWAREIVRHRVGGPSALKMQRQLGIGCASRGGSCNGEAAEESNSGEEEELEDVGNLWDVYPEGTSMGFLEHLDDDAWAYKHRGQKRNLRKPAKCGGPRGTKKPVSTRKSCSLVVPLPPSNAEQRARARAEAKEAASAAGDKDSASEEGMELHPLLITAPLPQRSPAPPRDAPPHTRPRLRLGKNSATCSDDEDASWSGARSFFRDDSARQKPRIRAEAF